MEAFCALRRIDTLHRPRTGEWKPTNQIREHLPRDCETLGSGADGGRIGGGEPAQERDAADGEVVDGHVGRGENATLGGHTVAPNDVASIGFYH